MLRSIEGVYRDGAIELSERPTDIQQARVIVTFLADQVIASPESARPVDLRARGIDAAQAAGLRARLAAFAEDWEREEMDAYDTL